MGVGYSVIYEKTGNEIPVIAKDYFPIIMLCKNNIISYNFYIDFMSSIYLDEPDYIILAKTRKKKVKILEGLEGKSFKFELKRFGVISKINDYYIFSKGYKHKIIVYNQQTNEQVFDYRNDSIFKFDMRGIYSIYVF